MSDLDILRELTGQLRPPAYDDLVVVARKRRRRAALGTAAVAAVVLLTVGVANAALLGGQRAVEPAQQPSPEQTDSPSPGQEWTPERIRAEGSPGDPQGAISTESGMATRLYEVCGGTRCDPADGPPEDLHVALEVVQGGRSAVFDLHYAAQPSVTQFDEDSVLVEDPESVGDGGFLGPDEPVRYRLLQADGSSTELQLLADPAPAVPGPGVVLIGRPNLLFPGPGEVYLIDDRAGTMRPLDAPADVGYWGPNVDEFLWGVTDDCKAFWSSDGTFDERQLDCDAGREVSGVDGGLFPDGWLTPGRMALLERRDGRLAVHVSLDYGGTWNRLPVADEAAIPAALRQLG